MMISLILIPLVIGLLFFGIIYLLNQSILLSVTTGVVSTIVAFIFSLINKKFNKEQKRKIVFIFLGMGMGILFLNLIFNFLQEVASEYIEILKHWELLLFSIFILIGAFVGNFYGTLQPGSLVSSSEYSNEKSTVSDKILDSSVIIDGRILKIAKTNFIEGALIIPNFVLREIQLISDSADPIKRNRGRRGLDMLNELQQLNNVKVKISYIDYQDIRDVDSKLIQLARDINGKLITNDFNLEKVAEVQGVQVLNLNALTEALRPIVLPGEELRIQVVKEGKDENQGIGYLDDGTMVVVEDGRELINKLVRVSVTSIIQTAAGKMIFTKALGAVPEDEVQYSSDKENKNKKPKENFLKKNRR